MAMRKFTL